MFDNLFKKLDYRDMIFHEGLDEIIQVAKQNTEKLNTIINRLDNNFNARDVEVFKNYNDLTISDIDDNSTSEIGTINDDSMDLEFSDEVQIRSIGNYVLFRNNEDNDHDSCESESECNYSDTYDDNMTDLDDSESFEIINKSEDSFSFDTKFRKYDSFFESGYVTVIEGRTVTQKRVSEHFTDTRHIRSVNEVLRYIF